MLPIRCFTCGKVLRYYEEFKKNPGLFFTEYGVGHQYDRPCCRRMYIGCVDHTDQLLLYPVIDTSPSKEDSSKEKCTIKKKTRKIKT